MTKERLLEDLKVFIEKTTNHYELPTAIQKGDTEQIFRAPEVHKMRLPVSGDAKKKAPYVLIQYLTGKDFQKTAQQSRSYATIRMVFAVYHESEEEGSLALLNLMETVRLALMRQVRIGACFRLDTDEGVDSLVYFENTAPYFGGEMLFNILVPPVEREVSYE